MKLAENGANKLTWCRGGAHRVATLVVVTEHGPRYKEAEVHSALIVLAAFQMIP